MIKPKVRYIALSAHDGRLNNANIKLKFPEGAEGIMFVFKTKKAARNYYGPHVNLMTIWEITAT